MCIRDSYYYYMKVSGGMYEADTPQDVVLGEFNYLIECLGISREHGYIDRKSVV